MKTKHRIIVSTFLASAFVAAIIPSHVLALGSTPVTIVNPADIAKAQGIQHPFQAEAFCANSVSNGSATTCFGNIAVPANQRLIIEYVSVECGIAPGEGLRRVLVNTKATALTETSVGAAGLHSLNVLDHYGVGNYVAMGQNVHFYADAGSTIGLEAQETGSHVGDFICTYNIIGQAIDVP